MHRTKFLYCIQPKKDVDLSKLLLIYTRQNLVVVKMMIDAFVPITTKETDSCIFKKMFHILDKNFFGNIQQNGVIFCIKMDICFYAISTKFGIYLE